MINAKQAREQVQLVVGPQQSNELARLHTTINEAIVKAVAKGLVQTVVSVPDTLDPTIERALVRVIRKMGYYVRLDESSGIFADNLYRLPYKTLTINWEQA